MRLQGTRFTEELLDVTDDFLPRPDARSLHGVDEETSEAPALQDV